MVQTRTRAPTLTRAAGLMPATTAAPNRPDDLPSSDGTTVLTEAVDSPNTKRFV
jgi:hypothetical protein